MQGRLKVRRNKLDAFEFDATGLSRPSSPPSWPWPSPAMARPGYAAAPAAQGKGERFALPRLGEEFAALGARVELDGDLMRVFGSGWLAGGAVDSRGDHRIAMAAAIVSLFCEAPVEIAGSECVAKSWPSFFEDLSSIAR